MSILDLSKLNDEQRKAVKNTEGPVLIIAGPGSGKTFTLVQRISYLIVEKGIRPENILVGTFTEKAAQELITRISNKLDHLGVSVNLNEMYIGTIHSICLRIIDENLEFISLKKNYRVFDQFEQQYFIYQNIKEFRKINDYRVIYGKKVPSNWIQARELVKWINKLSEELINPEKLIEYELNEEINVIGKIYNKYRELLGDENALDFSTIQVEAFNLLNNHQEILKEMSSKIQYIMIDEYQDTNTVQEKLILLLTGEHNNICVVGDDDQGLYRFRGATIRNILEFPDNFDDCTLINLDINYRSHPDIIDHFNRWINELDWDKYRYKKNIKPPEDGNFKDNPSVIKVSGGDFQEDWEEETYDFITSLKEKDIIDDYNQIAFLFRSVKNEKVVKLANSLESKGIPVYSPRSDMFFNRPEIKELIGALLYLFPPVSEIVFNNQYNGDISYYYQDCMAAYHEKLQSDDRMLRWIQTKAHEHMYLDDNLDYAFSGLFYQLFQFDTFKQYLDSDIDGVKDSRPVRNIGILSKMITKFEYLHNVYVLAASNMEYAIFNFFNVFLKFLKDGGINEYEDMSEYAPSGCISFLTIHQSKGMEFPIVFVGSLEGYPIKQYTEIDEILQNDFYLKPPYEPLERIKYFDFWRLFYTAFSRAQNLLVLTCIETKNRAKRQRRVPSKYFKNIYQDVIDWRSREFNIKELELEDVKKVNIKNSYSFTSHILLYENCPLQYKFYKELEFTPVRQSATIFGILIHQTIEDMHKAVLRGEEEKVTEEQVERWFNSNYKNIVKKEKVYLQPHTQKTALNQLLNYMDRQKEQWDKVVDTEVDVSLVKPDYILKGTIDLIQGKDDTVELVDFKSEKKPDIFEQRERIDRYRRQLEIYAHLVEERTGQKVSKLHLYYTGAKDENPYITFKKNNKSINKNIETFDNIVDKIEGKCFTVNNKDDKLCKECDMRFYCNY